MHTTAKNCYAMQSKRHRRALVALVALGAAGGCGPPPGDEQLPPFVHLLDDRPADSMTVEDDRLLFPRRGNEDLLDWPVGDLVVSKRGRGMLRAIEGFGVGPDTIAITTRPAALGEAVRAGHHDRLLGTSDFLDPAVAKGDGVLPFDGFVMLGDTLIRGNGGLEVTVQEGSLHFEPEVHLGLAIEDWKLARFTAVAAGSLEGALSIRARAEEAVSAYRLETLWKAPSRTLVQFIGGVPVVEVVSLSLVGGVGVGSDGAFDVELGGHFEGTFEAGAMFEHGDWHLVGNRAFSLTPVGRLERVDHDVSVSVFFYVLVSVELYGVAGPYIYLCPYLVAEREGQDATWSAGAGLMAAWGGSLKIFDKTYLGFRSDPLFDLYREF